MLRAGVLTVKLKSTTWIFEAFCLCFRKLFYVFVENVKNILFPQLLWVNVFDIYIWAFFSSLVKRRLQDICWKTFRYRQMWMHAFNKFCIDAWRQSKWFKSAIFENHHLDWMRDITFWSCTHDSNLQCI